MALRDLFRVGAIKRQARAAADERDALRARLGDAEVMDLVAIREAAAAARDSLVALGTSIESARRELTAITAELASKRARVVETDERLLLQEFGLYEPKYRLRTVAEYKARLDQVRASQAAMVKGGTACKSSTTWSVNGSAKDGQRMVRDYTKLILRAFNTECDEAVERVKFFNLEPSRVRMHRAYELLNRLGSAMAIQMTPAYLALKLEELDLAFEFQAKRQEEKDEQKKLREQAREEAKLQREIDAAREALAKEERHFKRAYAALEERLIRTSAEADRTLIESEMAIIREKMGEVEAKRQDVDYRAQNAMAGYVYVISNIGAFGEGVFKIGVTRRLEPMDRIDELGDASVPFDFDVHALVFSDNAYGLELALHRHFSGSRLNMVNGRKEFFRGSIEEIEAVLRLNFAKPVEVVKLAEAAEYRQSLRLGAPEAPIPPDEGQLHVPAPGSSETLAAL